MCNDHALTTAATARPELTRRGLLIAAGAGTAAAMVLGDGWQSRARAVAPASPVTTFDGLTSRSMAMHVHSSFSEGAGSMEAQFLQAQQNAVDVLWWTDHDHRMSAHGYRQVVHFTGLSNEKTDGVPWVWQKKTSGAFSSSSAGIVSSGSPNDTIKAGSLSLAAKSKGTSTATIGYLANANNANSNQRANVYGQQLTIDVLPTSVGPNGYLELLLTSSYHQARPDRKGGQYSVSYRFGGAGVRGTSTVQGIAGVVNVAVTPGTWNTVTLSPCDDITALWPDMDGRDFTTFDITLRAVSMRGFAVKGGFDYLRFERQYTSGDVPLQTQQSISDRYAPAFPEVTPRAGVEMSAFSPHVNWFGGAITMPDYTGVVTSNYLSFMQAQVALVHAAGGLTSYNHPFGTAASVGSTASQNTKMTSLAKQMLATKALGCDILEVGYPKRGGADLVHHVGLWDIMSRNGVMLTGNGTNDDHPGQNWAGIPNNWTTSVWTTSTSESDLLQALSAGRAWACSIRVPLTLDMLVDGECPMGSASVATVPSRQLDVFATGVPSGGKVSVLRGAVDYAGTLAAVPNTATIASYTDTELAAGSVSLPVDTSSACFVRTAVSDRTGTVVGLSNPIWLLDQAPLAGIPAARAR